jgi:hypothetical protein
MSILYLILPSIWTVHSHLSSATTNQVIQGRLLHTAWDNTFIDPRLGNEDQSKSASGGVSVRPPLRNIRGRGPCVLRRSRNEGAGVCSPAVCFVMLQRSLIIESFVWLWRKEGGGRPIALALVSVCFPWPQAPDQNFLTVTKAHWTTSRYSRVQNKYRYSSPLDFRCPLMTWHTFPSPTPLGPSNRAVYLCAHVIRKARCEWNKWKDDVHSWSSMPVANDWTGAGMENLVHERPPLR